MNEALSRGRRVARVLACLGALIGGLGMGAAWGQPTFPKPGRYEPTAEERARVEAATTALGEVIGAIPKGESAEALADVAVYHKAGTSVLKLGEFFDKKDVATTLKVLASGLARARALAGGKTPWLKPEAGGTVAHGYVSKVDGSLQPFAVVVPAGMSGDRAKRVRLDVVLHGRNATLSEVRFLATHDGKPLPTGHAGPLTLHVFGRGNNAYRWAGESDVFEAIEAVKRLYPVDEGRVALRGFSMGGAGAWHLGLHHPSLWSSVEAGAGFTESKQYAKLKDLPPYEEKALHIYDAADVALNAFDVPMVGYGGEDDPQLKASTNIVEALKGLGFTLKTEGLVTRGEGIDFARVVGAKMGHKVDPTSQKILDAFHDEHAVKGVDLDRKRVRFVTYTLKYNRAAWLSIERLKEHYKRAEVDASIEGSKVLVKTAENVAVLAVDRHAGETIVLGGEEFELEGAVKGLLPNVYFRDAGAGKWRQLDYGESRAFEENAERAKTRGLQGPIDDAFTGPFLCVRGTGTAWSPAVERWSTGRLEQFAKDWAAGMRGELRIKDDTAVTAEDIENSHLILFGDPGSNRLIAKVVGDLPMGWSRAELKLGGEAYTAGDHAPALVSLNPLNPRRYVVINSGHTFGAGAFAGTNALLYPRLGDHGVFQTDGRHERLKASGYFDEGWSLKTGK